MAKNQLEIKDLYGEQKELAQIVGIDIYIKMVELLGGCTVYIGKKDKIDSIIRNKKIKEEFNGSNYRILSKKYNLSERRVREIIDDDGTYSGQISIFDFKG